MPSSPGEPAGTITAAERALRGLISAVLEKEFGTRWLEHTGIDTERRASWERKRAEEVARRGREVVLTAPLLSYSEITDLPKIIRNNWALFAPILGDKRRFEMDLERLAGFRNALMHGRDLVLHERALVVGIAGSIRNAVTIYMSQEQPGGKEHFPRFEFVRDSLGNEITTVRGILDTGMELHVGDEVVFECNYWDPDGRSCETKWSSFNRHANYPFVGTFTWRVEEIDIAERLDVAVSLRSDRPYHRISGGDDDRATFIYTVLPGE